MTIPLASPALPLAAAGGEGLDYFEIVRNSGPVGMFVLALLLLASTVCWAIIAKKWLQIRRAQDESVKFLETFWQSKRLDAIYQAAEALHGSPISQVFRAGYVELSKVTAQKKEGTDGGMHEQLGGIENVERALKRAAASEVTHLEAQIPFLGTTASAAPFVGLFGTVWGIMNAFIGISESQTTNLAVVAPGIAEALLATALGLVAAIPAVMIYNHLARVIAGYRTLLGDASAQLLLMVSRGQRRRAASVQHAAE
jgi:biopolymer transport protein TolQ